MTVGRCCRSLDPTADPTPPTVADVDGYVRERIDAQADGYYRDRAVLMRRGLTRIRFAEFVLALTGVALAVVAGTADDAGLGAWVPVVTTVSASVMLYGYGARYQENLISYARTAEQLRRLRDDRVARMPLDPAEEARFVERCENVISIETQGWMARAAQADPGTTAVSGARRARRRRAARQPAHDPSEAQMLVGTGSVTTGQAERGAQVCARGVLGVLGVAVCGFVRDHVPARCRGRTAGPVVVAADPVAHPLHAHLTAVRSVVPRPSSPQICGMYAWRVMNVSSCSYVILVASRSAVSYEQSRRFAQDHDQVVRGDPAAPAPRRLDVVDVRDGVGGGLAQSALQRVRLIWAGTSNLRLRSIASRECGIPAVLRRITR